MLFSASYLCVTTNSPFWEKVENTGFKAIRARFFHSRRTWVPEYFWFSAVLWQLRRDTNQNYCIDNPTENLVGISGFTLSSALLNSESVICCLTVDETICIVAIHPSSSKLKPFISFWWANTQLHIYRNSLWSEKNKIQSKHRME